MSRTNLVRLGNGDHIIKEGHEQLRLSVRCFQGTVLAEGAPPACCMMCAVPAPAASCHDICRWIRTKGRQPLQHGLAAHGVGDKSASRIKLEGGQQQTNNTLRTRSRGQSKLKGSMLSGKPPPNAPDSAVWFFVSTLFSACSSQSNPPKSHSCETGGKLRARRPAGVGQHVALGRRAGIHGQRAVDGQLAETARERGLGRNREHLPPPARERGRDRAALRRGAGESPGHFCRKASASSPQRPPTSAAKTMRRQRRAPWNSG